MNQLKSHYPAKKLATTAPKSKLNVKSKKEKTTSKTTKPKAVKSRAQFVFKLHALICKENGDIVQWIDGGSAFLIKEPALFAKQLLPVYCGHKTFTSFERQMNFYRYVNLPPQFLSSPLRSPLLTTFLCSYVLMFFFWFFFWFFLLPLSFLLYALDLREWVLMSLNHQARDFVVARQ